MITLTFQKLINKWSNWGSWYQYKYSIMPQNSIYYLLISLTATASIFRILTILNNSEYSSFSLIKLPKRQYRERLVTILWARYYQTKIHVMVCNTSPIYHSLLRLTASFSPARNHLDFSCSLMFRDFTLILHFLTGQ